MNGRFFIGNKRICSIILQKGVSGNLKKKALFFVVCAAALTAVAGVTYSSLKPGHEPGMSYERYTAAAGSIVDVFRDKYGSALLIDEQPAVIAYPEDPDKRWASTRFDAVSDNAAAPMKKEFYIKSRDASLATKVGLYYSPRQKGQTFLSMNRIDGFTSERLPGLGDELPRIYVNTLGGDGIIYQITTFSLKPSSAQAQEDPMIRENARVTRELEQAVTDRAAYSSHTR